MSILKWLDDAFGSGYVPEDQKRDLVELGVKSHNALPYLEEVYEKEKERIVARIASIDANDSFTLLRLKLELEIFTNMVNRCVENIKTMRQIEEGKQ